MNPDYDALQKLELVAHGNVVASSLSEPGSEELELAKTMNLDEGLWVAARAFGENGAIAHTAPV